MFYDTRVGILTSFDTTEVIKSIDGDLQPYTKTINFDDGYQIEITKRLFCDRVSSINMGTYLLINNQKYVVIQMKTWSDYLELFLYESDT